MSDVTAEYLALLRKAQAMENEAITIGLQLLVLAPPEAALRLLEITADENDHDRIYRQLVDEALAKEPDSIDEAILERKVNGI